MARPAAADRDLDRAFVLAPRADMPPESWPGRLWQEFAESVADQQIFRTIARLLPVQSQQLGTQQDVVEYGSAIQAAYLSEHVAGARRRRGSDVPAVDLDGASRWLVSVRRSVRAGCFKASRRSDDRDEFALCDLQRDVDRQGAFRAPAKSN